MILVITSHKTKSEIFVKKNLTVDKDEKVICLGHTHSLNMIGYKVDKIYVELDYYLDNKKEVDKMLNKNGEVSIISF